MIPSFSLRPAASAILGLVVLIALPAAAVPVLPVLSVVRNPLGAALVTVPSALDSYFILWRSATASPDSFGIAEAVKPGTGNPLTLTSNLSATPRGFYRVQQEPLTSTLDLDHDTMPDAFELRYPAFLNPLDPADGLTDFDHDGVSNAQEYANGTDPSQPPGGVTGLVINEVDYDQIGADTAEFVEIYNPTAADINLTGLAIVFINGSNDLEYLRVDLGTAKNASGLPVSTLSPGQFLVARPSNVPLDPNALRINMSPASGGLIQNGSPDGIAIINVAQSTIIDALSYEGDITAAIITGFPAPVSLVEGTLLPASVADSNTITGSLCRLPNGTDTNNAATDWAFSGTPTPGYSNAP